MGKLPKLCRWACRTFVAKLLPYMGGILAVLTLRMSLSSAPTIGPCSGPFTGASLSQTLPTAGVSLSRRAKDSSGDVWFVRILMYLLVEINTIVNLCFCLSVCLSVCLCLSLSVCLSVCLSVSACLSVFMQNC